MNCEQLVLTSLLKRDQTDININKLWSQMGLIIKDYCSDNFTITPFYKSFETLLIENLNIELHQFPLISNKKNLIDSLKSLLQNFCLGMVVDIYEIPYCMYYKEQHELHMLEIIDYNHKEFIISDHYYNYYGIIDESSLMNSVYSIVDNFPDQKNIFFYLDTSNYQINEKTPLNSLKENIEILKQENKLIEPNLLMGIESISTFNTLVYNLFIDESNKNLNKRADYLHLMMKDVANSRFLYSEFLQYSFCSYEIDNLIFQLQELSRMWSIASNLVLMAKVKGTYIELSKRIYNRISMLLNKEKNVLNYLNDFLCKIENIS
ncbi:hypothetical protein BG30_09610 [Bacillus subtilis subsp. subtilis]|nr:hypothetical protein BG30_09610 [Bacillus subtilis subsp. subtilis]